MADAGPDARLHDAASGRTEAEGMNVTYESHVEPIKLGYLFDFVLPEAYPAEMRDDLTRSFELVFDEGMKEGLIDRPVEIVFREVEGLPRGTVKAVIDAYGELVDEGCLAVFGPRSPTTACRRGKRSSSASRCRRSASPARRTGWAS